MGLNKQKFYFYYGIHYYLVVICLNLLYLTQVQSQDTTYAVKMLDFCTRNNHEFSPIPYANGLVFCSNISYKPSDMYAAQDHTFYNLYFIEKNELGEWKKSQIFSKELSTLFNDGPATFNKKGDVIYYVRNNDIDNITYDITDTTNKYGIYKAQLINDRWENITPFQHNNLNYSFITPYLAPDENRLYFASDMPGGYGGTDLYYCDKKDTIWDKPINMGPLINTHGNESFPFVNESGLVFFSSDGLPGLGRKDIFYTYNTKEGWVSPIHLSADINSKFDDYGIITNSSFESGYFSSNRNKSDDIFKFQTSNIQLNNCPPMMEHQRCFLFYDERYHDSITFEYHWDFGDGIVYQNKEVEKCFDSAGTYSVKLRILDNSTDSTIFIGGTKYNFEIVDPVQPYITCYSQTVINKKTVFSAHQTKLPDVVINNYVWNIDGDFNAFGPLTDYSFDKEGVKTIKLGIGGYDTILKQPVSECVYHNILVHKNYHHLLRHSLQLKPLKLDFTITDFNHLRQGVISDSLYNASNQFQIFTYLVNYSKHQLKENNYQKMLNLSGLFMKFNEGWLTSESVGIIDELVDIQSKQPGLRFYIAVHSNKRGMSKTNLYITYQKAESIFKHYTLRKGNPDLITVDGLGETNPYLSDYGINAEYRNQRIEIIGILE